LFPVLQAVDAILFRDSGIVMSLADRLTRWTQMKAMKVARNILGTAGLLFAGYVFLASIKDSLRYIKISTM
jgi:hypothetical protein